VIPTNDHNHTSAIRQQCSNFQTSKQIMEHRYYFSSYSDTSDCVTARKDPQSAHIAYYADIVLFRTKRQNTPWAIKNVPLYFGL